MLHYQPIIQTIHYKGYNIGVLRLDVLHPEISGNKWFKLKYNLQEATQQHKHTIITFGGAYSNHIAATAFACRQENMHCVGIIRGEEEAIGNATISFAKQQGMILRFVTRNHYRQKHNTEFITRLLQEFPDGYVIPEGGANALGEKGCAEILVPPLNVYSHIYCAYGTGTTFRGMAKSLAKQQTLTAVNVLKYEAKSHLINTSVLNQYHCGGYAKHTPKLLEFKKQFENTFSITLDYVYTSKLFLAVMSEIDQGKLDKSANVLVVHSGGLQGNSGYEARYNLSPKRQVTEPQG